MAPPRPPAATPLDTASHPEFPDAVDPLLSSTDPLSRAPLAFADEIVTDPVLDDALPPLTIDTLPPTCPAPVAKPLDKTSEPPAPLLPLPTVTVMLPPRPPTAAPLASETDPVFPDVEAPLPSTNDPLTPLAPASDDATSTRPLSRSVLAPLTIETAPPAWPDADALPPDMTT
jgi:hypothetical protein